MIRELAEAEFQPFFSLMGEVEGGRHFDPSNPAHVDWLRDKVHKHYGRGTRFFGAYVDEKPAGVVGLLVDTHLHHDWGIGYITDLGVYPAFRRQGIGSELMDFVTQEARRQRCYCVYVDTYAASADNVAFYTRNGYVPVSVLPDANGPGDEGQVWLRKLIADH